jgi:hypothetical protein
MAYSLVGRQGKLILRDSDFPQLLRLGIFYGWEPQGTEKPEEHTDGKWNSREYLSCDGQLVRDSDARKLSDALNLSLNDIPDYDCKDIPFTSSTLAARLNKKGDKEKSVNNLVRYFSGEDKKKIQEFVSYTAKGGFRIF